MCSGSAMSCTAGRQRRNHPPLKLRHGAGTAHDLCLCSRGSRTKHSTAIPSLCPGSSGTSGQTRVPQHLTQVARDGLFSARGRGKTAAATKEGEKVSRILVRLPASMAANLLIIFIGSGATMTTLIRVMLVRSFTV